MIQEAKSDKHVKRLCRLVDECLGALGFEEKTVSIFTPEIVEIDFPIPFYDKDVRDNTNALSGVVLDTLTIQLRSVRKWLMDRGADIEFGLRVCGAFDMAPRPGWIPSMPRWGVAVKWRGPKPEFWPHPIKSGDLAPKPAEEMSDKEFREKYGEDPVAAYKRLVGRRRKVSN